jgi:hypothetical protein
MVDLKTVVDSGMEKLTKSKMSSKDPEICSFFDAILANHYFQNGVANTMQEIAQAYAGCAMTGLEGEDMKETLCKKSVAKPLLSMMFAAFEMGKAAKEAEQLDSMFGLEEK